MSTPVQDLLDSVWDNTNKATGHSWQRLNTAMRKALNLAIFAGYPFTEADFAEIEAGRSKGWGDSRWSFYRWCGASTEPYYALAVREGNVSAAKSYEAWKKRPPYIASDVRSNSESWDTRRLAVGFTFPWDGVRVTVTSFADDGQSLIACTYKPRKATDGPWSYETAKIERRYCITYSEFQAAKKAKKKEAA